MIIHKINHSLFDFMLIAVISIFMLAPLGYPGFFISHCESQHIWQSIEFDNNVKHNMFFSRWFPDFARGLGLPFLEFFPPFFIFFTEIFRLIGMDYLFSLKTAITVVTILGNYFCYLISREFWGRTGGIISGIVFSYIPYRLFDLYVRGELNEYSALSLMPLTLFLILKISHEPSKNKKYPWLIISLAILLLTHYPSVVIQLPTFSIFILVIGLGIKNTQKRKIFYRNMLISMVIALAITSPWWLNAYTKRSLVQMDAMTKGFADYRDQFIHPPQWFSFYWNFGANIKGSGDTVSFQLGNISLLFIIFSLPFIISHRYSSNLTSLALKLLISLGIFAVFLSTEYSRFFWDNIPILQLLQFPYRFLQISAVVLSILSGAISLFINHYKSIPSYYFISITSFLVILFSLDYCQVAGYIDYSGIELTPSTVARVSHTHYTGEFIPRTVGTYFPPKANITFKLKKIPEQGFSRKSMERKLVSQLMNLKNIHLVTSESVHLGKHLIVPGRFEIIKGSGTIIETSGIQNNKKIKVNLETTCLCRYNQFYFPGWSIECSTHSLSIKPDPETGVILCQLPAGIYSFQLKYKNLQLSRYLKILSILTIVFSAIVRRSIFL